MTDKRGADKVYILKHLKRGIVAAVAAIFMIGFCVAATPLVSQATEDVIVDTTPTDPTTDRDTQLTGSQGQRTNINDPGSSESPEDLQELNIANTVTITYDNGNGTLSGSLRILITLTLISLAPTLVVMMTSFTRIIVALHFTRTAIGTQRNPNITSQSGADWDCFIYDTLYHAAHSDRGLQYGSHSL